jgi:UDPglucose 6-dehydrogenase
MAKICVIGTGYVGLVSGACLADFGHTVVCVDIDESRIATLNMGEIPIYEPGLKDVVSRNVAADRLNFATGLERGVKASDVVFIAVGTPPMEDGGTDMSYVFSAAEELARHLEGYKVIVQKSTVPVGSARRVSAILREHAPAGAEFDIVSNPEFLREGSAIEDFMRPNRVVIGAESDRARDAMKEVYRPLYLLETPIVSTTLESAEMIKYAANSFLATKISFINEIAAICERTGATVDDVAKGVHDLNAGLVDRAVEKLTDALGGLDGRIIGLLGLAFKPNTDDLREAPSLKIVERLSAGGAGVKAFDPIAMDNFKRESTVEVEYCKNAYDCAEDSDAILLITEWNEFRELDFDRLGRLMRGKVFIDCRNVYKGERAESYGFIYDSFGRGHRD